MPYQIWTFPNSQGFTGLQSQKIGGLMLQGPGLMFSYLPHGICHLSFAICLPYANVTTLVAIYFV